MSKLDRRKEQLLEEIIERVYLQLVEQGSIPPKEELNEPNVKKTLKNLAIAGGISLSALTGLKGQAAIDTLAPKIELAYQVAQKTKPGTLLATIQGPKGEQSTVNLKLDPVHAVLSSKTLSDDLEDRVGVKLKELRGKGYMPEVTNLKVVTKVEGGKVITTSSCDIVQSTDGNAYTVFTTRGSIGATGSDYEQRHDTQISGLQGRLEAHFKGPSKLVDTVHIKFKIGDKEYGYKQSFYIVSTGQDQAVSMALMNMKNPTQKDVPGIKPDAEDDTEEIKFSTVKQDTVAGPSKTSIDTSSSSEYKVYPPHAEQTVGKSFAELLNQLDQEIGDELKARGGGYLSKYKISTVAFPGGAMQYIVDWEVRNDDPSRRYNAMTRRGNINTTFTAAKADVQSQVSNGISRLKAAGYTDIHFPFKDGVSVKINDDSYWFEMPILMNIRSLKENKLPNQTINRLKLLAGLSKKDYL